MTLSIRSAQPGEASLVFAFVRELADYEKLTHEVDATEAMIDAALFSPSPRVFCDLAEWNGSLGKRWNEFVKALRRHLMTDDLQYFKAVEPQRRFALHLHVLVRRDDGPLSISKVELRKLAMHYGFGHEVDVQGLLPGHASYVAKYASKAADDRKDVPWRGLRRFERVDMTTGEIRKGTAVAYRPTYRTWSASGRWGERMAEIRAAQGHHEAVMAALVPWSCRAPWPAEADVCPRRPVHARDGNAPPLP